MLQCSDARAFRAFWGAQGNAYGTKINTVANVLVLFSMRIMRIDRNTLVFKALCALDEVAIEAGDAPLKPSLSTRFALAFLYAVSDGDRSPYDQFWREIGDAKASAHSEGSGRYIRGSYARTAFTGIARTVGIDVGIEVMAKLAEARRNHGGPPRPKNDGDLRGGKSDQT
jgi:hypothetical protein